MNPARTHAAAWLVVILSAGLVACGAPNRFLLDLPDSGAVPAGSSDYQRIGLHQVLLPEYASSERIASLNAGAAIVQDENNRWAESPADAVARHLAAGISRRLAAVVLVEPFPRGLNPELQIEVRFDRFVRDLPRGNAALGGQFVLISGDGRTVRHIEGFSFANPLPGDDYAGYVAGLNEGLSELAAAISRAALTLSDAPE
ncbi:MAG: PqiC family protein [Pseudomonadota bacterium]